MYLVSYHVLMSGINRLKCNLVKFDYNTVNPIKVQGRNANWVIRSEVLFESLVQQHVQAGRWGDTTKTLYGCSKGNAPP